MALRPIFFDLETTGLNTRKDRIIEIAAFDPERGTTFQSLVHPQIKLSSTTIELCKITDEMVEKAPLFKKVAEQFISFCQGEVLLIAHNGDQFDFPFMFFELQRAGVQVPHHWYGLDSLKWARKYRRDLPRHTLQYLRQMFHVPENQAHRALDDVRTLWTVFTLMTDDLSCEEIVELGEGQPLLQLLKGVYESSIETSRTFLFS